MLTEETKQEFYKALLNKNKDYEGVFYVGVITTGIFCRPTCPAKKPKFENCEFYQTGQEALRASYRPCLRCQPLSHPGSRPDFVRILMESIEKNPEKRWKSQDFKTLSVDTSTVRRHFKKHFGMTFGAYARMRRMDLAINQIKGGANVIDTQLNIGYESSSGFRDAFSKIMGASPTNIENHKLLLKAAWLETRLGPMLAIADEKVLYLLEFVERRGLEREIEKLQHRTKSVIVPGETAVIKFLEKELKSYFEGTLKTFKTPLYLLGSPFQKLVWETLLTIPYGQTRSYGEQARLLGKPTAFRAVANANGANQFAIVIPCHRVINTNGDWGGYGGGLPRKKWLIQHEEKNK
ncbi:MAG: bifunctional transcriptional activator/DNA repair protein Ada [Proteobacteria bacterium]|nr:bifunctional transcriptional activator/DNA repair protein Ada [Pseudomonadota bacterium]